MDRQRRAFILGASSLAVTFALAKPQINATPLQKLVIVHETEVPASGRFANAWPSTNARTIAFGEDVTALIYERLVPIWREGDTATIGLTNARACFCLAQVAADHGLRLIHRGIHGDANGAAWPSRLAMGLERKLRETSRLQAVSIHELLPDGSNTLVSWAMVPRAARRWF